MHAHFSHARDRTDSDIVKEQKAPIGRTLAPCRFPGGTRTLHQAPKALQTGMVLRIRPWRRCCCYGRWAAELPPLTAPDPGCGQGHHHHQHQDGLCAAPGLLNASFQISVRVDVAPWQVPSYIFKEAWEIKPLVLSDSTRSTCSAQRKGPQSLDSRCE